MPCEIQPKPHADTDAQRETLRHTNTDLEIPTNTHKHTHTCHPLKTDTGLPTTWHGLIHWPGWTWAPRPCVGAMPLGRETYFPRMRPAAQAEGVQEEGPPRPGHAHFLPAPPPAAKQRPRERRTQVRTHSREEVKLLLPFPWKPNWSCSEGFNWKCLFG